MSETISVYFDGEPVEIEVNHAWDALFPRDPEAWYNAFNDETETDGRADE